MDKLTQQVLSFINETWNSKRKIEVFAGGTTWVPISRSEGLPDGLVYLIKNNCIRHTKKGTTK